MCKCDCGYESIHFAELQSCNQINRLHKAVQLRHLLIFARISRVRIYPAYSSLAVRLKEYLAVLGHLYHVKRTIQLQYERIYPYCSGPFIAAFHKELFAPPKNGRRKIAKYRKSKKKRVREREDKPRRAMKREYSFETQADHFGSCNR